MRARTRGVLKRCYVWGRLTNQPTHSRPKEKEKKKSIPIKENKSSEQLKEVTRIKFDHTTEQRISALSNDDMKWGRNKKMMTT
jgi:hypothetical protein